jgi:hypothetical protein
MAFLYDYAQKARDFANAVMSYQPSKLKWQHDFLLLTVMMPLRKLHEQQKTW